MAALEPILDQSELFLNALGDVEWVDDVTDYKCTRCKKILVQHYIANCDHKFCNNCKRLVDDGSQRWRCPRCREFIKEIGKQDFAFRDKVYELNLHCTNRKYGCQHITPFKQLKEHLERCKHTRESILPVLYKGEPMPDMLVEVRQLRWEVNEMKRKMKEMEKTCHDREVDEEQKGVNESAWELCLEVNRMKKVMAQIAEKQKKRKWKLKVKLSHVNDRVDGVKSDLIVETSRLRNEIIDQVMKRNSSAVESISLVVEENKAKILKLKGKTDAYNEMIEFNNKKNNALIHQLKNDFENELKTSASKFKSKMNKFESKWAETIDKIDRVVHSLNIEEVKTEEVTSTVKTLDAKVESLSRDLQENLLKQSKYQHDYQKCFTTINDTNLQVEISQAKTEKKMSEVIKTIDEKENKSEVETKFKKIEAEVDDRKRHLNEMDNKIEIINKNIRSTYLKMSQQVESINQETDSMRSNLEGKMMQLLTPLTIEFGGKVSKCKTEITKLEERTNQQNKFLIRLNKSTELINLEKHGFNLERFILLRFDQINCFILAEKECNLKPDFTRKINGINARIEQEDRSIISEVFEWAKYPVRARVKMCVNSYDHVHMSLDLEEHNRGKAMDLKLIPQVYYVLRDQTKTNNPKHMCRTRSYEFNEKFDYSLDFKSYISRKFNLTDLPYNVNDSIVFDIYVEPLSMAQKAYSYDGALDWAIDNFGKWKRMMKEELVWCHESPYFYTGARGYRVQVRMRLVSVLTVAIHFLPGEFDADLPLTFSHQTIITFFNQKNPQRNINRKVDGDIQSSKFYAIDICNDNEIENFILNDTLFYKVTIKPSN